MTPPLYIFHKSVRIYFFFSFKLSSVNGGECLPDDGLPMGAEATSEVPDSTATDEDDIGMEMDYDNLMAYFENLKESTA